MKKKILSVIFALMAVATAIKANEYEVYICGQQVSDDNLYMLSSIIGVEQGNISFDGYTLTLDNVVIDATGQSVHGITINQEGIMLQLVGNNRIVSDSAALCLGSSAFIFGPGKLEASGNTHGILLRKTDLNPDLYLYFFNGANVTAYGEEFGIFDESNQYQINIFDPPTVVEARGKNQGSFCNARNILISGGCQVLTPKGARITGGSVTYADGREVVGERVTISCLPINRAYFLDDAFRTFVYEHFDNGDGWLTDEELAATTIDVKGLSIQRLDGIEYFTKLTNLDCSNNQLTSLDLSDNVALTTLNCSNNELSSLVVSPDANALFYIDCTVNQLKGSAMDKLVESLPGGEALKSLCVVFIDESEGNVMTKRQVAAAKAKYWSPTMIDLNHNSQIYEGSNFESIALDETNFPDEVFRTFVKFWYDLNSDKMLSEEELANVKMIIAEKKNFTNLKGIEYFTELTELNIPFNQLTSLDVSNNTQLTRLDCMYNQLSSLNVSNNALLTDLDCSGNRLSSLDVSNCPQLTRLDCSGNQLSSLDVAQLSQLTTLLCPNNRLSSLDVSDCSQLDYLTCTVNQLSSLNVSNCSLLTRLDCSSNQLTSLDVSNCPLLTRLFTYNNKIKGPSMAALVAGLPLRPDSDGKFFAMHEQSDTEQNVMTTNHVATANGKGWMVYSYPNMEPYEGSMPRLIAIDENNFPDRNFRNYVKELCASDWLTEDKIATIDYINVSDMSILYLDGVEFFTELKDLRVSNNYLSKLNLSQNAQLENLEADGNRLTSLDLSQNAQLEQLTCCNNQLTSLDVTDNPKLNRLYCSGNRINSAEMGKLVSSLPTVTEGRGTFFVFDYRVDDQNVITTAQVAEAEGKGWSVLAWTEEGSVGYMGVSIATGIESVAFADPAADPANHTVNPAGRTAPPVYSLDGRRLDSQPTRKGIYIQNGRKVVVK